MRLGKPQNWSEHCLDRVWSHRRTILLGQRNHGGYEGLGMCDLDEATENTQGVPGGKVNILGGHSIGHSKQKKIYMNICPIPMGFRDRAI
jgi:hypothetical protein